MNAVLELNDRSTVLVIYDDPSTRARAMTACDFLLGQLLESVELDFHWWRTDFLDDANMARAAAHYAIAADFLIVCSAGTGYRANTLQAWFETWINERTAPEGVLIDLSATLPSSDQVAHLQTVLQGIARRGNLDYLSAGEKQTSPDPSLGRLSSILPASANRLPDRERPPSRFGLNE